MSLVKFYRGIETDTSGRYIVDMWAFDDGQLEDFHDYIQWLFPLLEVSRFHPKAPILNDSIIKQFYADEGLRANLLYSLDRLLAFYGFERQDDRFFKSSTYLEKAANWLTPFNHNFFRITRILRSLSLLGCRNKAYGFFEVLTAIKNEGNNAEIIGNSFAYWQDQAS